MSVKCKMVLCEQKGAKKKKGFSLTPEKKKLLKVCLCMLLFHACVLTSMADSDDDEMQACPTLLKGHELDNNFISASMHRAVNHCCNNCTSAAVRQSNLHVK